MCVKQVVFSLSYTPNTVAKFKGLPEDINKQGMGYLVVDCDSMGDIPEFTRSTECEARGGMATDKIRGETRTSTDF